MDALATLPIDPAATLRAASGPAEPRAVRDSAHAREVAEDFESFFITMFLETMWAGIPTDGLMGGGHAEGVYRSLLNQEYGSAIAAQGGIGLADNIHREILKLQEAGA